VGSPTADTGTTSDVMKTMMNADDKSRRISPVVYEHDPFLFPGQDNFSDMEVLPGLDAGISSHLRFNTQSY
jgi:hypothetical protein